MNIEKVGKAITYLRKRAGFTQKDLADRIGVSDKAVSKWERGIGLPDIAYLGKLAILLDIDTDSLLAGDVIHHDERWCGLIVLPESVYGICATTMLYDKPIMHYLLGYFLLVGIKDIFITCGCTDWDDISQEYDDGNRLGISLHYCGSKTKDVLATLSTEMPFSDVMIVFGRSFIYGVDQTRFFQKAMLKKNRITILSLPRETKSHTSALSFDNEMQLVNVGHPKRMKTQYDYYEIPIMFCSRKILLDSTVGEDIDLYVPFTSKSIRLKNFPLYTEVLDRGYVEIPIETPDDVINASAFVRIVQQACGMNIYCLEEIAWRRGMISLSALHELGQMQANTEYGQYILALANRYYLTMGK